MLSDGAAAEQISIHAPAKGATKKETGLMRVDQFQSTLPRRERPADNKFNSMPCQFQSTLPRRERHIHDVRISIACLDFNPRSREGSDFVISLSASSMINFNPRSREGSDFGKILVVKIHQPFQSTLPRRERHIYRGAPYWLDAISIHAPAKGATAFINIFSLAVRLFFISSHQ